MKFTHVTHKNAVVTGCSTGIGLATARLLKQHGWRVAATARKPADIEMLVREGFDAVLMDVANAESVKQAAEHIRTLFDGRIGALVNNAGFGQMGALEDLDRAVLEYQFAVNVIGLQDITNRFIPLMRKSGAGRIVNVSSVLGRVSLPFMGSYSASKFAVEALSDALRVELHGSGIAVCLVEPGPITTAFRDNAASRAKATLNESHVHHADFYKKEIKRREEQNNKKEAFNGTPEDVAEKILHAVTSERPKKRYKVTLPAYMGAIMAQLAPDWLMDRMMTKQAFTKSK
jgi:NAD(P)-dependent dehydrogenase (short-subunit alcohol dehydrogenase family)